jgi:sirohydrochlorin ferrochelatase
MRRALIVAHGQPSDPAPAAAALEALAARVAAHLPGWQVAAATLAQPGRLAEAAQGAPGVIFPLFMAGGWFTRVHIPQRLAEAGATGWRMLEPFGCLTAVHDLTVRIARESGAGRVLLAAHGSFKSPVPAAIAAHVAARIAAETGLPAATAFIDQAPQLETASGFGPDAVCLPFFAMAGGHVETDIPAALAQAGFRGASCRRWGWTAGAGADCRCPIRQGTAICAGACRYDPAGETISARKS